MLANEKATSLYHNRSFLILRIYFLSVGRARARVSRRFFFTVSCEQEDIINCQVSKWERCCCRKTCRYMFGGGGIATQSSRSVSFLASSEARVGGSLYLPLREQLRRISMHCRQKILTGPWLFAAKNCICHFRNMLLETLSRQEDILVSVSSPVRKQFIVSIPGSSNLFYQSSEDCAPECKCLCASLFLSD